MADARQFDEWDRLSALLQKIHNAHCTQTRFLIKEAGVFNPMLVRDGRGGGGSQPLDADFNAMMYEALRLQEEQEANR